MEFKFLSYLAYDHTQGYFSMKNQSNTQPHMRRTIFRIVYPIHNIDEALNHHQQHMVLAHIYQHIYHLFNHHMHKWSIHRIFLQAKILYLVKKNISLFLYRFDI